MAERIKTVEYDPREGGWIARDPNTGEIIGGEDWRWNCRASARDVVLHAKHRAQRTLGAMASVEDRARTLYAQSPRAYRGTRPLSWDEAPEATRQEFIAKAQAADGVTALDGKPNRSGAPDA